MTNLVTLKKEVDVLHKAFNATVEVPEWKKQSDEIIKCLKRLEDVREERIDLFRQTGLTRKEAEHQIFLEDFEASKGVGNE